MSERWLDEDEDEGNFGLEGSSLVMLVSSNDMLLFSPNCGVKSRFGVLGAIRFSLFVSHCGVLALSGSLDVDKDDDKGNGGGGGGGSILFTS
jgi:hypothetical protein